MTSISNARRRASAALTLLATLCMLSSLAAQVFVEGGRMETNNNVGYRLIGHFVSRDQLDVMIEDRTTGQMRLWSRPLGGASSSWSYLPVAPPTISSDSSAEDLDGDGWSDLSNLSGNGVAVYCGQGGATFDPNPTVFGLDGPRTNNFLVGDFDGNGLKDHLLLKFDPRLNGLLISELWIQGPALTFTRWFREDQRGVQQYPALADFNGDGCADIVTRIGGLPPGVLAYLPGTPQPSFAPRLFGTAVIDYHSRLLAGNFNGDAYADLLVLANGPGNVRSAHVFLGDPALGLVSYWSGPMEFGSEPVIFSMGDADGDGLDDLLFRVLVPGSSPRTNVKRSLGHGQFSGPNATAFIERGEGVDDWIDLDLDGDLDLLRRNFNGRPIPGFQAFENRARYGAGCGGSVGLPEIHFGVPERGDPTFAIVLSNALPMAPVQLFVSAGAPADLAIGAACVPLIDLTRRGEPATSAWFTSSTDAQGTATQTFGLPLSGAGPFYLQWAIVDPLGGLATPFGDRLATTEGRTIRIY